MLPSSNSQGRPLGSDLQGETLSHFDPTSYVTRVLLRSSFNAHKYLDEVDAWLDNSDKT